MSLAWLKVEVVLGSMGKAAAASLLLASLGLAGCGDDPPKKGVAVGCTLNSDCNSGLVCSFGLCHKECAISDDCPANQRCVQGKEANVCQLNEEAECHFKSDCDDPLVCAIDLQCRNQCQEDEDCLTGQKCADKVCAEPAEVNMDGGLKGAVDQGGAAGADGGGSTSGTGGTGGTGATGQGGEGGEPPATCTPGGDCVPPGEPCAVGIVSCVDGKEQCDVMSDADDGTECGTDQVCEGGECVACKAGEACQPDANNVCLKGSVSCANGPACDPAGNVTNGTECGTDKVCSAGACVDCKVGDSCQPTNTCKNGTLACAAGPVCNPTTNKSAGTECDTGKVCDSAGACKDCVQDGVCEADDECHVGKWDCTTGPNCVDTQLPVTDGASCAGPALYNFCVNGTCGACQNGSACVPPNDKCHKGTWNCGTTPPTCNATQQNATDGLACDDGKSCISGQCLTNDRVLSVTSGAPADKVIDAAFDPVSVKLVDAQNKPVQGAALTVTAAAGAHALASSATNASGVAQITGRVGRAVGSYKFTVSAPGATSIDFSVKAIAPNPKDIFTVVNAEHQSGYATVPGAGSVSKLYSEARAVTSAKDGSLYLAGYCSVYRLSPAGVLTQFAGQTPDSCAFAGDSGLATQAKVSSVSALALDEANGFLYIADHGNARVRQVDLASGNILTFAGGGTNAKPYGDGGPADAAYVSPSGISVAPNGDVYISDGNASSIRKVDYNTGVISTVFSSVTCNQNGPLAFYDCGGYGDGCAFAWDKDGKLFISAYLCGGGLSYHHGVARVEADKSLVLVAGGAAAGTVAEGGAATSAGFQYNPTIAFDKAGNLFLTSRYEHRVRRVDAITSKITTVAGTGAYGLSGDYGPGHLAQVYYPTTVSLDDAGNLYFADSNNMMIRAVYGVGATTASAATLATTGGTGQTVKRDAPFGALTVKLTDGSNAAIPSVNINWRRLETGSGLGSTGASATTTKTSGSGTSSMTGRVGLASGDYKFEASYTDIHGVHASGSPQTFTVTAADPEAGTIFPVVNYVHNNATGGYPGPATFAKLQSYALGVVTESDGSIYAADQCAIYKISPRGEAAVFAGTPGSCAFAGDSGPAAGAKLYYPEGMAIDETKKVLYIADQGNQRIRMVSLTTGVIDTLAGGGSVTTAPYGDGGPATDANIGSVSQVSVDANGLVYIPDYSHNRIRVVNPDTTIISTWLAGNTTCVNGTVQLYSVDQYGTVVRFNSDGSAYVSGRICEGVSTSAPLGIALRASNGSMTRVAGLQGGITTENADATASALPDLADFIVDGSGNLILAMYTNNRVRRIDKATGKIATLAGDGTAGYALPSDMSVDPGAYVPSTGVRLYYPFKLALWNGHLLIADEYNYSIRMIW